MTENINILLISKDENCTKEVTDFLHNSKCISGFDQGQSSIYRLTTTEYAKPFGPSTVIKESEHEKDLRVYFLLKPLDTIKSNPRSITRGMFHYDAVIVHLNDGVDTKLILDYVRSPMLSDCLKPWHNVTIIGKLTTDMVQTINDSKYRISRWRWNKIIAYNLCAYRLDEKINLWSHITKGNHRSTKLSYNLESTLMLNIIVFEFMHSLFSTMYFNINDTTHKHFGLTGRTEAYNSVKLLTLISEGNLYAYQEKTAKDLLVQLDVLNLSDFNKLLKEEIKQLAHHLSPLTIFCGEIVHFTGDLYSQLFHRFRNLVEFKDIYYKEVPRVNGDNIAEAVFHSLNAMSEMKYTGKYIKDVLGIEKLHELKSCLKKHYSFRNVKINSLNIPTSVKDDSLGNGAKQNSQLENGIQTMNIEDRIGNIQLLNSLQKTLQELTEELKNVRQLQEHNTKVMTKDIREIKEKLNICNCNPSNQKHDQGGFTTNE